MDRWAQTVQGSGRRDPVTMRPGRGWPGWSPVGPWPGAVLLLLVLGPGCAGPAAGAGRGPVLQAASPALVTSTTVVEEGPGGSQTPAVQEGDAAQPDPEISGGVAARYRYRRAGDEHDHDLFTVVEGRVEQQDAEGRKSWTAYAIGRVAWDLDGRTQDANLFSELEDARGSSLDAQLYEAYLDLHAVDGLDTLRVGRMWLLETPVVFGLDGALMEASLDALGGGTFGAYGGLPHYEYEASPEGDNAGGIYLTGKPWDGARLRFDWMKVTDDMGAVTARNDLYAIQLRQSVAGQALLRGRYSWIDGTRRDAELSGTWHDVDADLMVHAMVREQFTTLTALVNALDPFSTVLQDFQPFRQQRLLVSKGLGDLTVEVGADSRSVSSSDQGQFNREFDRWHVTATRHDLGLEGLSVGLTAEQWDADGVDQDSWGLDATRQVNDQLRVSAGTYYALYKNDFLLQQERERVRTWYLRGRWKLDPRRTVSLGYEYESADLDHFNTLTARMSWRF